MEFSKKDSKSKVREIEVSAPWAGFIFDGSKKVEMRKNKSNGWGVVKAGDKLLVKEKGTQRQKKFVVKETRTYDSLHECFIGEGVRNLLPGKKSLQEALDVYLGFDGSSEESIQARKEEFGMHGCIAIELVLAQTKKKRQTPSIKEIEVVQKFFAKIVEREPQELAKCLSRGQINALGAIFGINEDLEWARGQKVYKSISCSSPKRTESLKCTNTKRKEESLCNAHDHKLRLQIHVNGSLNPEGIPGCTHTWESGAYAVEYNQETIGGCGSEWQSRCLLCGKVWYD